MMAMTRYTARADDWIRMGLGAAAYTTLVLYLIWPIALKRTQGRRRTLTVLLAAAPLVIFAALVWLGVLLVPKSPWLFVGAGMVVGTAIGVLGMPRRR